MEPAQAEPFRESAVGPGQLSVCQVFFAEMVPRLRHSGPIALAVSVIDGLADQSRTFGHLALFRTNHSQQNQAPGPAATKVLAIEIG